MSVIVISPQMLADVTRKAQTFRDYGFPTEERMMCKTLANMNRDDIRYNKTSVMDYFFRLFRWNTLSYELKYLDKISTPEQLREDFDHAMPICKEINIYQFEMILAFLIYNIEDYEIESNPMFQRTEELYQMKKDFELLKEIRDEVCRSIVSAIQNERGVKWCY